MNNGFGRMGQPGVREEKKATPTSEITVPLAQGFAIWLLNFIAIFGAYVGLKMFITTRADWTMAVVIVSVPALLYGMYRVEQLVEWPEHIGKRLLVIALYIAALSVALWFCVDVLVPQATYTLDQQAHVVAAVCAGLAGYQARKYTLVFFRRQLTDSLRDSDSSYATKSLEYEHGDAVKQLSIERDEMEEMVKQLQSEVSRLQDRPDIRIVPSNHGQARGVGVSGLKFSTDLLSKFILDGFGERGVARAEWVGQPAIDRHGDAIRQQDWTNLTHAFTEVGLIVAGKPVMDAPSAFAAVFRRYPDPPSLLSDNGGEPA